MLEQRTGLRSTSALAVMLFAVCVTPARGLAAQMQGRLQMQECVLPEVSVKARCGTILVRENPQEPRSRQIPIHFAVVPAKGTALGDPIVPLMGGPGEDAIGAAAVYAKQFDALRARRDLLLVDQRGTGESAPLRCELFSNAHPERSLQDLFPPAAVERCERALRKTHDLTQYGYTRFAGDLERLRTSLGYDSLNLFAGSYGTRAAVVFLRDYPKSVRTALLLSVVPIDIPQPLPMARTADSTFDGLLQACERDRACHGAFPELRAELAEMQTRLDRGVEVSIPGRNGKFPLSRGRVMEWMRSQLYRPKSAAALPWYIDQAHRGNWEPLVTAILAGARAGSSELSLGLLFAIACNEDIPFLDESLVREQSAGTHLGDYRVREQQAACKFWPRSPLPPGYRDPVRSAVPTLFVSGDADGATPLSFMQHVAPGFSDSVQVVARGQGHTQWSDCVGRLYQRLVETASTRELSGASCEPIPRPPFKTGP